MKFHDHTPPYAAYSSTVVRMRNLRMRNLKHHDGTPTELVTPMLIGGIGAPRYDKGYIEILTPCPSGGKAIEDYALCSKSDSRLERSTTPSRIYRQGK